jgi:superfamily II DNA or RNA helicase
MDKLIHHCSTVRIVHAQTNGDQLVRDGYRSLVPVTRKERDKIYEEFAAGTLRKIISTYVYKQGVNFPQLSVVVNAGGGGSDIVAKQIPGRESRNIEGKEESYLIDFWHDWDTIHNEDGRIIPGPIHKDDRSREKAYRELGFEQVWLDKMDDLPFLRKDNGPVG